MEYLGHLEAKFSTIGQRVV